MTNGVAITNSRRRLLALCDISLQRNDLSPGKADSRRLARGVAGVGAIPPLRNPVSR
jgi:hypothetical protein